jgi:diguanylate cyclase (GGDEF)-like protein
VLTSAAVYIYWLIVLVWLSVLGVVLYFYVRNPHTFGTARVLLAVLAIDTLRNIVENVYFGAYFGAQYGTFPQELVGLLGRPELLILPKLFNVAAGALVLTILLLRWLPEAMRQRRAADDHAAELGELAATDPMTGLSNRRDFSARAEAEIARCRRHQRPLTLLMIDIDRFKAINDEHGHAIGDEAIVALAEVCRRRVRESDLIARVGGEEFAVLLPETDRAAAHALAETLRDAVSAHRIAVLEGDLMITVSIGVSVLTDGTLDTLMKQADLALYEAKRSGRDRTCVFAPELQAAGA